MTVNLAALNSERTGRPEGIKYLDHDEQPYIVLRFWNKSAAPSCLELYKGI